MLYASPANALAFVCDWFQGTADTSDSLLSESAAAYENSTSAHRAAVADVGPVGHEADPAVLAWLQGLGADEVEALLSDVFAASSDAATLVADALAAFPYLSSSTVAAAQQRYVCGVVKKTLEDLQVHTSLNFKRAYVLARTTSESALARATRAVLQCHFNSRVFERSQRCQERSVHRSRT